jgi:predicted sulfurtransferase
MEDLRTELKQFIHRNMLTLCQFSRLAGISDSVISEFLRGQNRNLSAYSTRRVVRVIESDTVVKCSHCEQPKSIRHYMRMVQQPQGVCMACWDKTKQREGKRYDKAPKVVTVRPNVTVDDARVMPREVAKPSTVNGVPQDLVWHEDFFGIRFNSAPLAKDKRFVKCDHCHRLTPATYMMLDGMTRRMLCRDCYDTENKRRAKTGHETAQRNREVRAAA